jgi:hypothetical protein
MDLEQGWRTGRLDLEPLLAAQRVAAAAGPSPTSAMHNGEFCWIRDKTQFPEQPGSRHS